MAAIPCGDVMAVWRKSEIHRVWLRTQVERLYAFYQPAAFNPGGGFHHLDDDGKPENNVRQLHETCRMVHCFALGQLLGRAHSAEMVDHGMGYLWQAHRDPQFGGYVWSLDDNGTVDATKQGYGHAFVLLAASSAKAVGHPD